MKEEDKLEEAKRRCTDEHVMTVGNWVWILQGILWESRISQPKVGILTLQGLLLGCSAQWLNACLGYQKEAWGRGAGSTRRPRWALPTWTGTVHCGHWGLSWGGRRVSHASPLFPFDATDLLSCKMSRILDLTRCFPVGILALVLSAPTSPVHWKLDLKAKLESISVFQQENL